MTSRIRWHRLLDKRPWSRQSDGANPRARPGRDHEKTIVLVVVTALLLAAGIANSALAQKRGGTLKLYFFDSPASMSIHEEATIAGQGPMMGVFNNLVMYKQDVPQASLQSVVPDLGEVVVGRGRHRPDL